MAMEQLSLIDSGAASHRTDPDSSRRAARRHEQSGRLDVDRRRVLEALKRFPGVTSKQLATICGFDRYMVAKRLPDLRRMGLVQNVAGDCGSAAGGDTGGELRWWAVKQ